MSAKERDILLGTALQAHVSTDCNRKVGPWRAVSPSTSSREARSDTQRTLSLPVRFHESMK